LEAGILLTGNIGSLCEQQPLKALRAPSGPISQSIDLNIKYYIITGPTAAGSRQQTAALRLCGKKGVWFLVHSNFWPHWLLYNTGKGSTGETAGGGVLGAAAISTPTPPRLRCVQTRRFSAVLHCPRVASMESIAAEGDEHEQ
jgi:hypothetical protein